MSIKSVFFFLALPKKKVRENKFSGPFLKKEGDKTETAHLSRG